MRPVYVHRVSLPAEEVHGVRLESDLAVVCLSFALYLTPDFYDQRPNRAFRYDIRKLKLGRDRSFPQSDFALFTPDLEGLYYLPAIEPYAYRGESGLHHLDLRTGAKRSVCWTDSSLLSPTAAALSSQGVIASLGPWRQGGRSLCRFDVRAKEELDQRVVDAMCLAWSPDGAWLALGGPSTGVRLLRGEEERERWEQPANVITWEDAGLAWAAGTQGVVAGGREWAEEGEISALAWAGEGRILVGTKAGRCVLRDSRNSEILAAFDPEIGPIHSAACSRNGTLFAVGGDKGRLGIGEFLD